jgi:SAM-dependent methyltransferase
VSRDEASTATYLFKNRLQDARRRLELLEQCHDSASVRRLEALGVTGGWQCLEAGAGAGSIARWLCSRVAPAGRVLAIDVDTRFLQDATWPCLEVRQENVVTDDLEPQAFDLVHTRMLLMNLDERARVLQKLIAALRPGGWLLLEEGDIYPMTATASGRYRRVVEEGVRVASLNGLAMEWARNLPQLLDAAGLADVGAEVDTGMFHGASPMAEFWQITWQQLREPLLSQGELDERALDETIALLETPGCWFADLAMVAAWGRRPG